MTIVQHERFDIVSGVCWSLTFLSLPHCKVARQLGVKTLKLGLLQSCFKVVGGEH